MKYTEEFASAIKKHLDNPTDTGPLSSLASAYWSMMIDVIGDLVREKGDIDAFLTNESDLVNFGLCSAITKEVEPARHSIIDIGLSASRIKIQTVSEWLSELVVRINRGDRKEVLQKDIILANVQISKVSGDIGSAQMERKNRISSLLGCSPAIKKQVDSLEGTDDLLQASIRTKRSISRGVFFSVEQKREHFNRENQLQKEIARSDSLISSLQDRETAAEIKKLNNAIAEGFSKIIELEEAIEKMEKEVDEIDRQQEEISVIEIENRVRRELEYLRDLIRLSAKRLHLESCPILRPGEKHFTVTMLIECIDRVLEFDPQLLKNDRVNIFGPPQILLVPGTGNALYDWKNNRIIVPLLTPGGNFMAAFAAGVIEYRLDVDEDKQLLNSYNQIPDHKTIRSVFQLRGQLVKDYILWMTSEYKGYRILAKDVKEWFEHEIAPSKNEIFTPLEYQQFMIAAAEYKVLLSELEAKLKQGIEKCSEEDLWVGSILWYQQGKFERSLELLANLIKRNPSRLMAHYNIGHVASKLMKKQEAVAGFTEYCSRNAQSWWARIAREHLRRLQS